MAIVATLALGIGAVTAILSVVHATLVRPHLFPDVERLVMVVSAQPDRGADRRAVSYPDYEDWRDENAVFTEMAASSNVRPLVLTGGDRPEHLSGEFVSWNYFRMIGVEAAEGRTFLEEEDQSPEGPAVVVLSHALWQQRFAGDRDIVGQAIVLNGTPYTVVGVAPESYRGVWWDHVDVWLPITAAAREIGPGYVEDRGIHWHLSFGRLRPGVTIAEARRSMNRLAEELEGRYPETNTGFRVSVFSLGEAYFAHVQRALITSLVAAVSLLVLCCVNVASLLLARGTGRRQELTVRSALGASRRTLAGQLLTESVLLALLGGVLGIGLAFAGTGALMSLSAIPPVSFPDRYLEPRVLATVLAICLSTGLVFGVAPVLQGSRWSLQGVLRGGQGGAGGSLWTRRWLSGLAVVELALALVLVAGAGLMVQSFRALLTSSPGFSMENLVLSRLDFKGPKYQDSAVLPDVYLRLRDGVEALPGVEAASLVGPHPPPQVYLFTDVTIEDRLAESSEGASLTVFRQYVTPGHLQAAGIPLLQGRDFTVDDTAETPLVVIVSETVAAAAWPNEDPIGKRLRRGRVDDSEPWWTVVGVASRVQSRGLKEVHRGPDLDVYLPILQDSQASPWLLVRHSGSIEALLGPLRETVWEIDPDVPVYNVETMEQRFGQLAADDRFYSTALGLFALVALLVAAVGVYGVLSYGVRQRRRELGVRQALGATGGDLLAMILRSGARLAAAGLALGLVGVVALRGLLASVLYGIDATDPRTLLLVSGVIVAVALVAVLVPARRAVQVSPSSSLRES